MKVQLLRAAMALALVLGLVTALAIAGWTAESTMTPEPVTSITTLKTRVPDTLLAKDGASAAEIVVPDAKEYLKLGDQVRDAIRKASGAETPVRKDSEFAGKYGTLSQTPKTNLIVLGNLETSNLIALLYARKLCCEDAIYPGDGGYAVRTVNDPWGSGTNVIILGGSNLKGVTAAAGAFSTSIPQGRTVRYPGKLVVKFTSGLINRFSELGTEPTDASIAEQLAAADKAFRAGVHSGLFPQITAAGFGYLRTGKPGYARLFRDMTYLAYDLYNQNLGTYGGPWGMDADFKFMDFVAMWDVVEESPVLTDEDRLKITNIILEYIRYWESYWSVKPVLTPGIRNNHTTFTSLGFMFAADYFGKYYNLPQAKHWMAMADGCFQAQQRSFKPQEDSNSYQWITLHHMMTYALARPDATYLTSGKARIGGDLAIMTMDNLGYQVSFGDVGGFHGGNVEMYLWRPLAAMERDGRYMWAYRKGYAVRPQAGPNAYHSSVEPEEPSDLLGVKWLPTDEIFYKYFNGNGVVPQERTFEKISFRTSFDPEKPYMLLDGISGCGHGHSDGNSVLRLTDKGRIWLGDCDYIKAQPKFHNMLSIFRDGQSFGLPAFSEREIVADLGRIGITRTTTPGCSGTDWSRNILWDKQGVFVFIDEVEAKIDDEFSVRCFWQTLGKPQLDGQEFTVEQNGPSMTINNLDGARLRTWDDPVTGKNWANYKHADPIIRVLQQTHTQRLKAGERVCFLNIISTQDKGKSATHAERVNDSSILIGRGKDRALVGVRASDDAPTQGVSTDARVYWLAQDRIALGEASSLKLDGVTLLTSSSPVSVELEAGGTVTIDASTPASITFPVGAAQVLLDGKRAKTVRVGGQAKVEVAAGRHILEGVGLPERFAIRFPKPQPADQQSHGSAGAGIEKLTEAAEFRAKTQPKDSPPAYDQFMSLATDGSGIYVGGTSGKVYSLSPDGKPAWEFDAGSAVKALWVGKLSKDEPKRIAVGTVGSMVYLLDENGKQLWKQELPYYKRNASVVYFSTADLVGDGNRALIVGSENWHHYAFDSKGAQLWKYESIHASTAGCPIDLDGDGKEEYIAGTEYYWWHGVSAKGEKLWQYRTPTGPRTTSVVAGDVDPSGKPTVFFGGADGFVHAVNDQGVLKWQYSTGDEITGLALSDVNGDGIPEIVAGSLSFNVVAVKGDGKKLWRCDIGEPVKALAMADMNGDGSDEICAGTEDGRVVVLDRSGRILAGWSAGVGISKLAVIPGSSARLACATTDGKLVVLGMP